MGARSNVALAISLTLSCLACDGAETGGVELVYRLPVGVAQRDAREAVLAVARPDELLELLSLLPEDG